MIDKTKMYEAAVPM